jgi:hydrogenase maturation protein HypF
VGFRPFVWRLAGDLGLAGDVRNDGEGVLIAAWGAAAALDTLEARLRAEAPRWPAWRRWSCPLAGRAPQGFLIAESGAGWRKPPFRPMPPPAPPALPKCKTLPSAAAGVRCDCPLRPAPLHHAHAIPWTLTAMAGFCAVPACRAEYDSPADPPLSRPAHRLHPPVARACGWKGRKRKHRPVTATAAPAARGGHRGDQGSWAASIWPCDALNLRPMPWPNCAAARRRDAKALCADGRLP